MPACQLDLGLTTRCECCGGRQGLTRCDCCGLWYCTDCACQPDEGGFDCPNDDCNLHP